MPLPPFIRHFAFVEKVRAIFDGTIVLAGSVLTGWAIRAAPSQAAPSHVSPRPFIS